MRESMERIVIMVRIKTYRKTKNQLNEEHTFDRMHPDDSSQTK